MAITTYLSTITLNVNGSNAPIKRYGCWMNKKTRPLHMLPIRDSLDIKTYTNCRLGYGKIFHENGNLKKGWGGNTCSRQNKL